MIECDETITVLDIVSTKKINTIAANVTSTASINCGNKRLLDCYNLPRVLLATVLLLIIIIVGYHYEKQKTIDLLTI